MTYCVSNPYCIPCEDYSQWVELIIRDEHNQPFPNIKGTLTDGSGKRFPVVIGQAPILLKNIAAGRISIQLEDEAAWLKEAQQRMPYDFCEGETETPTRRWYNDNCEGYEGSEREFFNITMGEFINPKQGPILPERCEAGKADWFNVIHNRSAVIQIQGFRAVTLRFGMFFDGTANNSYSSQWGKVHLDEAKDRWVRNHKSFDTLKLPERLLDVSSVTGKEFSISAGNELTNVQKMHDLYLNDTFSDDGKTFYHREYITGIGTEDSTAVGNAEESKMGNALGVGKWGVAAKTLKGVEQVCESIAKLLNTAKVIGKEIDAITKIEFDVFGFSRGSAAARNFANVVLDGESGEFAPAFKAACEGKVSLVSEFDWTNNDHCQIKFAGLFDTVASVIKFSHLDFSAHNDDNGTVRLYLDPKRVERAVHIVANRKTEYRSNFGVNLLNTDGGSQFTEVRVMGAHSDIGGGYYSATAFDGDKEYRPPRAESKLVGTKAVPLGMFSDELKEELKLREKFRPIIEREVAQGWREQNYIIECERRRLGGNRSRDLLVGNLIYRHIAQGDLSRLYLRAMYGLAEHAGVPVTDYPDRLTMPVWETQEKKWKQFYSVPEKLFSYNMDTFNFRALCDKVLEETRQGKLDLLSQCNTEASRKLFVDLGLIHHSADTAVTALVIVPFGADDSEAQREQRENEIKEINKHEYARMEYAVTKDH